MINKKNILLVDDDADDLQLFKDAAGKYKSVHTFATANNGKEAIEYLKNNQPPDLIFLDLNMPIVNGIECLRNLKDSATYKHIPVVIFSTSNNPVDIHITRKIGAQLFFHKPDNFDDLCNKVERLLESDALLNQSEHYLV